MTIFLVKDFGGEIMRTALMLILMCSMALALGGYEEDQVFQYLQKEAARKDKDLRDFLIGETRTFLRAYPDGNHSADGWLLLGDLYQEKGMGNEAFAAYLRTAVLFPQTEAYFKAVDHVRHFLINEKNYKEKKEPILEYLDRPTVDSLRSDRFFNYLELLVGLEQKELRDAVLADLDEYVATFPLDERCQQVILWKGLTLTLNDKKNEANAAFDQFSALYPDSPLMPQSLFLRGDLLTRKMGKHEEAAEVLSQLLQEYPQSLYDKKALLLLGEIKSRRLKDHTGAINIYGRFVEKYPDDPQAYAALWAMAEIYRDKLKDYPSAISTLDKIFEKDTVSVEAIAALEKKAEIYRKDLNQPISAATALARLVELFPNYDKAPDRLMEAGELCEKDNSDPYMALEYYRQLVRQYPEHKKGRDAARKIEKLKERFDFDEQPLESADKDSTVAQEPEG